MAVQAYSLTLQIAAFFYLRLILILLCILSCMKAESLLSSKSPNPKSIPTRFVKGVYEVPATPNSYPVIYDSYFPIIYEFRLPSWDANTMKIQFWKNHNNCTESDNYSDGYPCPVMHHMNALIENFTENMTLWKNLFLDSNLKNQKTSPKNSKIVKAKNDGKAEELNWPHLLFGSTNSHIQSAEFYCAHISPHFSTFQTSPSRMGEYMQLMKNCGNDTVKRLINLNETAIQLEKLYHTTFSSFTADYWDKLPEVSSKASAVTLWTALETTLMLHQFMETQKWTNAMTSCQNGQIPWSLIDHKSLSETIKSSSHFDDNLAISLGEMSKYYKLPLTDCVFVGDETLVVRILVPLNVIATQPYRIIKFEPVVFHEDGEFCWIDEIRNKRFIADYQDHLYVTDCSDQEQQLCKTSDKYHASQDKADPCALALYKDWEEEIVESCFLKCLPAESRHDNFKYFDLVYITEDNYLYSVADEDTKLSIECEGKETQVIPLIDFGAWNITIPCGCKLKGFDENMEYPVQPPCGNKFILEKIKPYHWRTMKKMSPAKNTGHSDIDMDNFATGAFETDAEADEETFMGKLDERYGKHQLHYIFLWIVVLALLIVVVGLTVAVFKLYKWKQVETYKANRLIYNVRDNGDAFSLERQGNNMF